MSVFLKHFFEADRPFFVSEFGHSAYKKSKKVGPWSREIYILHIVIKGYADFSGFRAEAGQAFLIAKERMHAFTISDDYEHYWIGFAGASAEALLDVFGLRHDAHQLFYVDHLELAHSLLSSVCEGLKQAQAEQGEGAAFSALTALFPLLKSERRSSAPHKVDYAEKVHMFIKHHYMYPIKMADIAKEIHLSEKYMYRLFYRRFNRSPQAFLIQTRMEIAGALLKKGELSVSETAAAVGYASLPVFSKTFSGFYGCSPTKYKEGFL